MSTYDTPSTEEANANTSPNENQDGEENNEAASETLGRKTKHPFPYHGGIFSEAARRKKAAQIGKAIDSIIGQGKKLNLAY